MLKAQSTCFSIALVSAAGVGFLTTAHAQVPIASYDSETGAVIFTQVEEIVSLRLDSPNQWLINGEITDLDGHATGNFGVVNDSAPDFVEWGNLLGMNFEYSIAGNILPPSLEFEQVLDEIAFTYSPSSRPSAEILGHWSRDPGSPPIPPDPPPPYVRPDNQPPCPDDGPVHAIYNSVTGGITFCNVERLVHLVLESPAELLLPGGMTNLDGAVDGNFGVINPRSPSYLEWGQLLGMTFQERFAGTVLPTRLSASEIAEGVKFVYGTRQNPSLQVVGAIVTIAPEPGSSAIAVLALPVIGFRRPRRKVGR